MPQLTNEILLNNFDNELIGRLDSSDLIQLTSNQFLTPLELYRFKDKSNLYLLHQTSPILNSKRSSFLNKLTDWFKSFKNLKIILLASADKSARNDSDILSNQLITFSKGSFGLKDKPNHLFGSNLLNTYFDNFDNVLGFCVFSTEGDNRFDAFLLFKTLSDYLNLPG